MPYSSVTTTSEANRKKRPVTIREKVKNKYPDFDENVHQVYLNNEPVARSQLDMMSSFIDIISIETI